MITFQENEKRNLEDRLRPESESCVSETVNSNAIGAERNSDVIPTTRPQKSQSRKTPHARSPANHPFPNVKRPRLSLGPDGNSFFADDVGNSQIPLPSQQTAQIAPPVPDKGASGAQCNQDTGTNNPTSDSEDRFNESASNILDSLTDEEILVRLSVDMKNTCFNWSDYKTQRKSRRTLGDKCLGNRFQHFSLLKFEEGIPIIVAT